MKSFLKRYYSMIIVSLFFGLIFGLSFFILGRILIYNKNKYYAVFLSNGNIYFGKISTFPRFKLKDPYFVQVDQQGNVSINRFKEAFWQPEGTIYLNKNFILFIAPLDPNSEIIKIMKERNSIRNRNINVNFEDNLKSTNTQNTSSETINPVQNR